MLAVIYWCFDQCKISNPYRGFEAQREDDEPGEHDGAKDVHVAQGEEEPREGEQLVRMEDRHAVAVQVELKSNF